MNLWNAIVNGIIENFSPIIAALIAAIIAGISAYLTWKSYKSSHDSTPPELLKYEKWLDIMKKRKEVLDNMSLTSKGGKFPEDREASFVNALELYECSAIWEGKVLENTPKGPYRKFLLKLDPQESALKRTQKEDTINPRTFDVSGIYFMVYITFLFISGGVSALVGSIMFDNSDDYSNYDRFNDIVLPGILIILWNIISVVLILPLILNTPRISELYYHRIQGKTLNGLPGRWKIFIRAMHIVLTSTGPFPKLNTSQWVVLVRAFLVGCVVIISCNITAENIVYSIRLTLAYNKDYGVNLQGSYSTLWSFLGWTAVCIVLLVIFIRNFYYSNVALGEYELKVLDNEWKDSESGDSILIKDGTLILKKEGEEYKFELSIKNMRKIYNNKSIRKIKGYMVDCDKNKMCKKRITIESKDRIIYITE